MIKPSKSHPSIFSCLTNTQSRKANQESPCLSDVRLFKPATAKRAELRLVSVTHMSMDILKHCRIWSKYLSMFSCDSHFHIYAYKNLKVQWAVVNYPCNPCNRQIRPTLSWVTCAFITTSVAWYTFDCRWDDYCCQLSCHCFLRLYLHWHLLCNFVIASSDWLSGR